MPTCERLAQRGGGLVDGSAEVGDVKSGARERVGSEQLLGVEVGARRIVLMQRVHSDAIGGCAGGLRQGCAKRVVAAIADPDPVDRAQDDRSTGALDHDSPHHERIDNLPRRLDARITKRTPHRRRGVTLKRADGKRASQGRRGEK